MDQAREFLSQFSGPSVYAAFYFLIFGCGVGLPMNSDFCLITASVLAALGVLDLKLLMVFAFLGLMSGDTVTFFLGRKFGTRLLKVKPVSWLLSEKKVLMAENFLNTKGTKFLFIVRFLPLIRTPLFFAAGSLQVAPRTFYIMNVSASLIYLPIIMLSSFYASSNIDQVIQTLKRFQFGLLGAVVLTAVLMFFRKKARSTVVS